MKSEAPESRMPPPRPALPIPVPANPGPARRTSLRLAALLLAALVGTLAGWPGPAAAGGGAEEDLAEPYRRFLADVRLLISKKERREFLALDKDHQRDAFIEAFWRARDPYPETRDNEFRDDWYQRLDIVRAEYRNDAEDRARILLFQGYPDAKSASNCAGVVWPQEVWHFGETAHRSHELSLVFYQDRGVGSYRLWNPNDGLLALFGETKSWLEQRCFLSRDRSSGVPPATGSPVPGGSSAGVPSGGGLGEGDLSLPCALELVDHYCAGEHAPLLRAAILQGYVEFRGFAFETLRARIERPPQPRDDEWLASFAAYSTDLPEEARTFPAELAVRFGEGEGGPVAVEGEIAVPAAEVETAEIAGRTSYDFDLLGEVFRGSDLHESFRYRFDVPRREGEVEPSLRLVFVRDLRPGAYRLVLRVEDLHGGGFWRGEREIEVPEAATVEAAAEGSGGLEGAAAGSEVETGTSPGAAGEGESGGLVFHLVVPADEVVSGMVRVDAQVAGGEVAKVTFFVDGRPVLSKGRPPYGVEVDLGRFPRPHTLRAVALDAAGRELASDEARVNLGDYRFTVELVEPATGSWVGARTEARVAVHAPEGRPLERVELFVGEERVATLYQPPFVMPLDLPSGPSYVRAVAYLADGAAQEDLSFVNAGPFGETVDVRLVEIYASVVDAGGRPVEGLGAQDFTVREDGAPQTLVRFEAVRDRPLHLAILFDTSMSMADRLPAAREAAGRFLAQVLTPKDRAAVVAFSEHAGRPLRFTAEREELDAQLAALKAEGGTALFDNLVGTLVHFNGVPGQRAVLLLSDGKDRLSHYSFDDALALARSTGVAVYAIGLDLPRRDLKVRRELGQLSEASGGRSFFVDDVGELATIYAAIEAELRARYLLAYQAPGGSGETFRAVEVQVARPGLVVKAPAGYYP